MGSRSDSGIFMYHFIEPKVLGNLSNVHNTTELRVIEWGLSVLFLCAIMFLIYYVKYIPSPMRIINFQAMTHIFYMYLHLIFIVLYNTIPILQSEVIFDIYSTTDLLLILSGACLTLNSVLRVYIPESAEFYFKKDMISLSTFFLGIIESFEYIFCWLYDDFLKQFYGYDSKILQSSLRLTSISLLLSTTIFILACLLVTIFLRTRIRRSLCLFFIIHLSVTFWSDMMFILYNFYTQTKWGSLFAVILITRPVVEMVLFIVSNSPRMTRYLFVTEEELIAAANAEKYWSESEED